MNEVQAGNYEKLFDFTEQLSPLLKGRIAELTEQMIHFDQNNDQQVFALYNYWKNNHPKPC